MHNRLPTLFHRATMEAVRALRALPPGARDLLLHPRRLLRDARARPATSSPTSPATRRPTGAARAGHRLADHRHAQPRPIGGAYGFTTDIGGYFDVGPYSATTKELFIRWTQWAALSPMFRVHGSVLNGRPHAVVLRRADPASSTSASPACTAGPMPLIMRLWKRAQRTGIPIARPLWLAYPRDERAARAGPAVDARAERAGGPGGRGGRDLARGLLPARAAGAREAASATAARRRVEVAAPLMRLPFFIRCGTSPFKR